MRNYHYRAEVRRIEVEVEVVVNRKKKVRELPQSRSWLLDVRGISKNFEESSKGRKSRKIMNCAACSCIS